MDTETSTITRRELLKRGAFVGGAVLWVAPVVQVVGMGRAYAKETSPNCIRYCLKWDVDANNETGLSPCADDGPVWTNIWEELGEGEGNKLTCPDRSVNDKIVAAEITNDRAGFEFAVYGSQSDGFWIAFPNDIKLANLEDKSEPWSAAVKCGQDKVGFEASDLPLELDLCFTDTFGDPYRRIFIPACGNERDISHIELVVDWCWGDNLA